MEKVKSFQITLAAKTLSDSFTMETYAPTAIGQVITGTLKNFPYRFMVEERTVKRSLSNLKGIYDIDEILSTPLTYYLGNNSAIEVMTKIAAVFKKNLCIQIDDFSPIKLQDGRPTYRDVVRNMFGWTDIAPQRQINVMLRGDSIVVLQRGKETDVRVLSKTVDPTITEKRLRVLDRSKDNQGNPVPGYIAGQPAPEPEKDKEYYISGTFTYGDASVTYANGLVVKEVHAVNGVDEVTTYDYSSAMPPALLRKKTTIRGNIKNEVAYEHSSDEYLVKETEKESDGDKVTRTRITRHIPLGQGFWGTSIEENGNTVSYGVGQGAAAGKASPYSIREHSADKKFASGIMYPPVAQLPARVRNKYWPYDIPVCDVKTLKTIAEALAWLDNKVESRITLTAYEDDIIDFDKRIMYQGNEYYLESNRITRDTNGISQQIELVRWY